MRENNSSTVTWPSSCYTGVDLDLKYRARMNGISPTSGSTAIDILNNNNNNSGNSNNSGSVKAERFSPPTGDNNSTSSRSGTPVSVYEGLGGERASPMALSLSHARERDPLKAMEQATSRNYSDFMRSLAAKYNHTNPNEHTFFSYFSGAPTPSTGASALTNRSNGYTGEAAGATAPVRPNALLPNRGDSSLAALQALKAGAIGAAPFLMAPLAVNAGTTGQSGGKEGSAESAKSSDSSTSGGESANRWSFGASPFATPGAPVYHPSIDMSSTQALINMVRTASAQSANQLETYLKGIKRGAENPLDLSATKKARKSGAGLSLSESLYGDALLGLPMLSALNRASKDLLPPTHRLQTKSPKPSKNHTKNNHATSPASGQGSSAATTNSSNSRVTTSPVTTNPSVTNPPLTNSPVTSRPQCISLCADKPCAANSTNGALFGVSGGINAELAESGGSGTEMTSWTVEEVASFVGTIDICAEYAGNFRDQCIDGSALPLLTEAHLTTALQMKLGPALKLRSVLSRRLGNCAVCMHCVHCHGNQASLLTGPQALLQNPQASLLTGPQALLQNPQASLLTGPQALLQNPQASLLTGPQTLLQNPQASLLTGPQTLLQNSQASLLTGPQSSQQALTSTPQPPPSTPSPKPLTRPNSTGN